MFQLRVSVCSLLVVLLLSAGYGAAQDKNEKKVFKASVGSFSFPISDNRLVEGENNRTLEYRLSQMWDDVSKYWNSYENPPPEGDEVARLTSIAHARLEDEEKERYTGFLVNFANTSHQNFLATKPNDTQIAVKDFSSFFLAAIDALFQDTAFWGVNSLMGVGRSVQCSSQVNAILQTKGEWEKASSSAATTLMALVPTMLAFGNLYVPRSSEVFATSALVGLSTSVYSLGLPVQSISAVRKNHMIELALFGLATVALITAFADIDSPQSTNPKDADSTLKALQSWTDPEEADIAKQSLGCIRSSVSKWPERWHWWNIPSTLIAAGQVVMFGIAVAPLFIEPGVPNFLLACTNNVTGLYLSVSAVLNALFRIFMWEVGSHERLKIYSLSPRALGALRTAIANNTNPPVTTATEFPPLYRPLLSAIREPVHYVFHKITRPFSPHDAEHDIYVQGLHHRTPFQSIKRQLLNFFVVLRYTFTHLLIVIKSGIITSARPGKVPASAVRRYRPLIVLIHLSTAGRNVLITLFTGFVEALLLLVLTFFFAAQWGGNLLITGYAMLLLIIFITAGRIVGVLYVYLSTRVWGLHVVNCDEKEEVRAVLRIISSMVGVLVQVNGASYCDGYRLDAIDSFDLWRKRYEMGEYDADIAASDHDTDPARTSTEGKTSAEVKINAEEILHAQDMINSEPTTNADEQIHGHDIINPEQELVSEQNKPTTATGPEPLDVYRLV